MLFLSLSGEIDGDHFGFRDEGEREGGIVDAADAIAAWLRYRFAPSELAR